MAMAKSMSTPTRAAGRDQLLPQIVTITPTAYETWKRCPREYLLSHVLAVPESDGIRPTDHGLLLHELLRIVHEQGTCRNAEHVNDVLAGHGVDDPHFGGMLARHARRCPDTVETGAHEVDLARFHRAPAPMFMATARIDAIWVHDGLLDARDYKTGSRWYERVADDPRARVQAFVLEQHARRRGLRLRLRYEHLAAEVDDDPEPYEPDDEELAGIDEELRATVAELWSLDEWHGVADEAVCGWCRFRSICPDSAAPGEPGWPVLALGDTDVGAPSTRGDTQA
ncbi:MAG: putative RecB family exonuclease [Actinomycetota bacterium]|nr:putative RecB family exonuclease [Actinomycetota bacterium]